MIPVNVTLFGMSPLRKSVKDAISRSPKSDTVFIITKSNCLLVSRGTLHLLDSNEEYLSEIYYFSFRYIALRQLAIDVHKGSLYLGANQRDSPDR